MSKIFDEPQDIEAWYPMSLFSIISNMKTVYKLLFVRQ